MSEYKTQPFEPGVGPDGNSKTVANELSALISSEASGGWEFVALENHATVVPGSSGCFGFGATSPYPKTFSVAVFKR